MGQQSDYDDALDALVRADTESVLMRLRCYYMSFGYRDSCLLCSSKSNLSLKGVAVEITVKGVDEPVLKRDMPMLLCSRCVCESTDKERTVKLHSILGFN